MTQLVSPSALHLTLSGLTPSMVILLTKHSLVCEVLHDKPHASREDTHQDMEVKEDVHVVGWCSDILAMIGM